MVDALELVSWCIVGFTLTVLIPLCAYSTYRVYRVSWCMIMRKRQVHVLLVTLICLQLTVIFGPCAWVAFMITSGMTQRIIGWIMVGLYPICVHGTPWALAWRVYKSYYDGNYAQALHAAKWQSIINSNVKNENIHWSMKYQSTLGNDKFIGKIIITGFVISCIISYVIWTIHYNFGNTITQGPAATVDASLLVLLFIVIVYFYYNTPDFTDIFFVKIEIKRIFYAFSLYYGTVLYYIISLWDGNTDDKIKITWDVVIFQLVFNILPMSYITYISTHWVLNERNKLIGLRKIDSLSSLGSSSSRSRLNGKDIANGRREDTKNNTSVKSRFESGMHLFSNSRTDILERSPTVLETLQTTISLESQHSNSGAGSDNEKGKEKEKEKGKGKKRGSQSGNSIASQVRLENILLNFDTFNLFVIHLMGEYSIEILVSIIEFNQFLQEMECVISGNNDKNGGLFTDSIKEADLKSWNETKYFKFGENVHIPQSKIMVDVISDYTHRHKIIGQYFSDCFINDSIRNNTTRAKKKGQDRDGDGDGDGNGDDNASIAIDVESICFDMFNEMGYQLYCKYVKVGSQYEINISSLLRQNFSQYFAIRDRKNRYRSQSYSRSIDHENEEEHEENANEKGNHLLQLFEMFKNANKTMATLLGYTFTRFARVQNVDTLKQQLLDNHPEP